MTRNASLKSPILPSASTMLSLVVVCSRCRHCLLVDLVQAYLDQTKHTTCCEHLSVSLIAKDHRLRAMITVGYARLKRFRCRRLIEIVG